MHLLQRIERHLRRSGTAATRFGREAVNDPRFVTDLRNGRELRPRPAARVLDYLSRIEATPR